MKKPAPRFRLRAMRAVASAAIVCLTFMVATTAGAAASGPTVRTPSSIAHLTLAQSGSSTVSQAVRPFGNASGTGVTVTRVNHLASPTSPHGIVTQRQPAAHHPVRYVHVPGFAAKPWTAAKPSAGSGPPLHPLVRVRPQLSGPGTGTAPSGGTITLTPTTFSMTEGTSASPTVGAFTDSNNADTAADFIALIDWGDGTQTTGTVSGGAGAFSISGSHTYADEGTFDVTVKLFPAPSGALITKVTSEADVAEADTFMPLLAPVTVTFNEGPNVFICASQRYQDTGYPGNSASDFIGSINWGDGSTDAATVSFFSAGVFLVSGPCHQYMDEGTFIVTVTISDDPPGTATATSTVFTLHVTESDNLVGTGLTISPIEQNAFSGAVATFTDTGFPGNTPSDFTATINWGDGTPVTPASSIVEGSPGNYTVNGTHTYADDGHYTVTVTMTDDAPGTDTATATGAANVREFILSMSGIPAFSIPEGATVSGPFATLTDPGATGPASDYSGTINWGDGTTTAATIVSIGGGQYRLVGTHTYTDEGSYTITVTAWDNDDPPFTISIGDSVTVTEADTFTPVSPPAVTGIEGHAVSGPVAKFSDTGYPGNVAGDFTATITWGDGASSPGAISKTGAAITVSGTHTYADEGVYAITVNIADDAPGTATGTEHNTATIADAPLTLVSSSSYTTNPLVTFGPATLLQFHDTAGPGFCPISDFSATINWGDGSPADTATPGNSGIVSTPTACTFSVRGSHFFLATGNYTVTITVHDIGGASVTSGGAFTPIIHVVLPPTTPPGTPAQRAVAANTTTTQPGYTVGVSLGESTVTTFGGGVAVYLDPAHSFNLMACYTTNTPLSTCRFTVLSVSRTACGAAGAQEVIYARYYKQGSTTGYLMRIQLTQGSTSKNGSVQINAVTPGPVYIGTPVIANVSMTC